MPNSALPPRPNLDKLKKLAKSLLAAAHAADPTALNRFRLLPAFAAAPPLPAQLALHDAQSVIAREYGFPSWNALRDEVEARSLTFSAAVDAFLRSAVDGASARAERLLALQPAIATASFATSLVLGEAPRAAAALARQPALATQPTGPLAWEPLLYVCQTRLAATLPARLPGLVETARLLLSHGANPNAQYHWNWHPELPRTALWAAVCTVENLPLAQTLLAHGANPTDGVTQHIAAGNGNLPAFELLHRYGAHPDGQPGGVPPLAYLLHWADTDSGARWLLAHGADPNLAWGPAGESPLHIAARRWTPDLLAALVDAGADLHRPPHRWRHTLRRRRPRRQYPGRRLAARPWCNRHAHPAQALPRRLRPRRPCHCPISPPNPSTTARTRRPPTTPAPRGIGQHRGSRNHARLRLRSRRGRPRRRHAPPPCRHGRTA